MVVFSSRFAVVAAAASCVSMVMQASSAAASVIPSASLEARAHNADHFDIHKYANRIVYSPHILSPSAKTVWKAGRNETVKWAVNNATVPEGARNSTGEIYLGYLRKKGQGGENLKYLLASDFPITAGSQEVTVPDNLETRHDYIVVLVGDSGNRSNRFTIIADKKHNHPYPRPAPSGSGNSPVSLTSILSSATPSSSTTPSSSATPSSSDIF